MSEKAITTQLCLAMVVMLCTHLPAWGQRPSQRSAQRTAAPSMAKASAPAVTKATHESVIASDVQLRADEFAQGPEFCDPACVDPIQHLLDWSRCDLVFGTVAFTSPTNFLTSGNNAVGQVEGSFGFQEAINFGNCMPGMLGGQVGAQIGLRATQSQLNGNVAGHDARNQLFVTGGLFRRVDYGVQGGLVVDYLHDDWLAVVDLSQIRGELSFAFSSCHDAGVRVTSSLNTDQSTVRLAGQTALTTVRLTALDSYRFFYRCGLGEEGRSTAEFNAGFTEDRDAVLGFSLSAPLHGSVGMTATTTYLIPHSGAEPAYARESWSIGLALVWTPCRPFGCGRDYYRPLFEVADNGSLLTKQP